MDQSHILIVDVESVVDNAIVVLGTFAAFWNQLLCTMQVPAFVMLWWIKLTLFMFLDSCGLIKDTVVCVSVPLLAFCNSLIHFALSHYVQFFVRFNVQFLLNTVCLNFKSLLFWTSDSSSQVKLKRKFVDKVCCHIYLSRELSCYCTVRLSDVPNNYFK